MSEHNDINAARSVMDSARKIAETLEEMSIERHITVVEMVKAQTSFRIAEIQKKDKAEHDARLAEAEKQRAEIDRANKFGIAPGGAHV